MLQRNIHVSIDCLHDNVFTTNEMPPKPLFYPESVSSTSKPFLECIFPGLPISECIAY